MNNDWIYRPWDLQRFASKIGTFSAEEFEQNKKSGIKYSPGSLVIVDPGLLHKNRYFEYTDNGWEFIGEGSQGKAAYDLKASRLGQARGGESPADRLAREKRQAAYKTYGFDVGTPETLGIEFGKRQRKSRESFFAELSNELDRQRQETTRQQQAAMAEMGGVAETPLAQGGIQAAASELERGKEREFAGRRAQSEAEIQGAQENYTLKMQAVKEAIDNGYFDLAIQNYQDAQAIKAVMDQADAEALAASKKQPGFLDSLLTIGGGIAGGLLGGPAGIAVGAGAGSSLGSTLQGRGNTAATGKSFSELYDLIQNRRASAKSSAASLPYTSTGWRSAPPRPSPVGSSGDTSGQFDVNDPYTWWER